jgi:hypothetical protein
LTESVTGKCLFNISLKEEAILRKIKPKPNGGRLQEKGIRESILNIDFNVE